MEPFIGQIVVFGFNFAPQNYMFCQGQTLDVTEYPSLFNIIGTTYGGDGTKTFMLPDTTGVYPVKGFNYAICVAGTFPVKAKG